MNITVIGHVCLDHNISEKVDYQTAGGPAMFMSKVFSSNHDVKFKAAAPYGTDFTPYTKNIFIYPEKPSHTSTLIYENKSQGNLRTQKEFHRQYTMPLPLTQPLIKTVSNSDIIFFAPLTPNYNPSYIREILSHTKTKALKILLPQGYFRNLDNRDHVIKREFIEAHEIIPLFDFVIVSEQDHPEMKPIASTWAKNTKVIMTLGDQGSQYLFQNQSILAGVESVKEEDIVDSVGSGDIFSACFGYQYYLTKDIHNSLKQANNMARRCLFYPADDLEKILSRPNIQEIISEQINS